MQNIRFLWNAVEVDGKKFLCWYSDSKLLNYPEGTITIYSRNYKDLPRIDGLGVENNSDMMTDYMENDKIRVEPANRFYKETVAALNKAKAHSQKINLNRQTRAVA